MVFVDIERYFFTYFINLQNKGKVFTLIGYSCLHDLMYEKLQGSTLGAPEFTVWKRKILGDGFSFYLYLIKQTCATTRSANILFMPANELIKKVK